VSLKKEDIDVEVIDLRSLKPMDKDIIFESVKKTGRLVIVDAAWKTCGVAAEIAALVAEEAFEYLKSPIIRVALPDVPAPASSPLEKAYYPGSDEIIVSVKKILK